MLNCKETTRDDLTQIAAWTEKDEFHREINCPDWWTTGNGALSFRLDDDEGPVVYIRLDSGELYRLHCQFPPQEVVNKRRLVHGMLGIFPLLLQHAKDAGAKGLVFDSVSHKLVRFMAKLGFEPSWEHAGEYVLRFEE
jgi:hypothetical protein